jgi:hypothetical protein
MTEKINDFIYQIDVGKKYIIVIPEGMSMEDAEKTKMEIDAWLESDEPFIYLFGAKIEKINSRATNDRN